MTGFRHTPGADDGIIRRGPPRVVAWAFALACVCGSWPSEAATQDRAGPAGDSVLTHARTVAVLARDSMVVASGGQLYVYPGAHPILATPHPEIRQVALWRHNMSLTVLDGDVLGYVTGGEVRPVLDLPAEDVRLYGARDGSVFLYGGSHPRFERTVWRIGPSLTLEPIGTFRDPVRAITSSADGWVYAATADAIVRLRRDAREPVYRGRGADIRGLCAMGPDRLLVAAGGNLFRLGDGTAVALETSTGAEITALACGGGAVLARVLANGRSSYRWLDPFSPAYPGADPTEERRDPR